MSGNLAKHFRRMRTVLSDRLTHFFLKTGFAGAPGCIRGHKKKAGGLPRLSGWQDKQQSRFYGVLL